MKQSNLPLKVNVVWGSGAGAAYVREVPDTSQITVTPGAASWTDGFVPLNLTAKASGGIPPAGQDMNGALRRLSAWAQYLTAAGIVPYDATFQTAIGGYPRQAAVASATTPGGVWLSVVDDNTTNPDTGGAGWAGFITTISGSSSNKVNKAPGVEANQVSGAGSYISASTATKEAFSNIVKNNLGTSTFANSRLTVGVNEAGIWSIQSAVHLPAVSSSYYCQIAIYKNGTQVTSGTTTQATASTGQYLQVGGIIDLAVGDYIEIYVYQQSSSAITSVADNTTNFSAFLTSSY